MEPESSDQELSDEEEEMEPKLRYERILNDMPEILRHGAASCIAVHPKFIALGMHGGMVYILDHQGNNIRSKELELHRDTVTQLSIDEQGDHLASCSRDGKVVVHGLYSSDHNQVLVFDRPVGAVAIDPNFYRSGSGRRFVTGIDKVVLHTKGFLSRYSSTILHQGEGPVRNIAWKGRFAAWATDLTILVCDMQALEVISMIRRDHDPLLKAPELHRCVLAWRDERCLLLGWADRVKVCCVRQRERAENPAARREQHSQPPDNYVEIVSMFGADYYVCGLAPLGSGSSLVALTVLKGAEDSTEGSRPQLRVVEPQMDDCVEQSSDILSVRGFRVYRPSDYCLDSLPEEGLFFVVSPKDVIVAKPRDQDDHLDWLLQHHQYEEALQVTLCGRDLKRHTLLGVGQRYLAQLVQEGQFARAGEVCRLVFGADRQLWEAQVFQFARLQQLRALEPVLPRSGLSPTAYEMVLNEFLQLDPQGLLRLLDEWDPSVYSVPTLVNAVRERLSYDASSVPLLRALARLYSFEGKHDLAIAIYLKIRAADEVFALVRQHGLYGVMREKLALLIELDEEKAVRLLVACTDHLPPATVTQHLRSAAGEEGGGSSSRALYRYLDALFESGPSKCEGQHMELARLYAQFAPDKLLPLLRLSHSYPLEEALRLCREHGGLVPETVFLLKRMGNTKEALQQIMEQLQDVQQAIAFCKEQDDAELWEDLIEHSLDKPPFITTLLHKIGAHVNPILLIMRIPNGLDIPRLRDSLVKIIRDYNLQISLREGCRRILVSDCISLLRKLHRQQSRGIAIAYDQLCHACNRRILSKDVRHMEDVVVFFCKHAFHSNCLPSLLMCSLCSADHKHGISTAAS